MGRRREAPGGRSSGVDHRNTPRASAAFRKCLCVLEVRSGDPGPYEILDEAADPSPADDGVQPFVDLLIPGDRQLLLHEGPIRRAPRSPVDAFDVGDDPEEPL